MFGLNQAGGFLPANRLLAPTSSLACGHESGSHLTLSDKANKPISPPKKTQLKQVPIPSKSFSVLETLAVLGHRLWFGQSGQQCADSAWKTTTCP